MSIDQILEGSRRLATGESANRGKVGGFADPSGDWNAKADADPSRDE
jgi:hypothetical protein